MSFETDVLDVLLELKEDNRSRLDKKFTFTVACETAEELAIYTKAVEANMAICHIGEQLRQWTKYGHDFKTVEEALDACRTMFWDTLNEEGYSV